MQEIMFSIFSDMIELSKEPNLPIYAATCWAIATLLALYWAILTFAPKFASQAPKAAKLINSDSRERHLDSAAPAM